MIQEYLKNFRVSSAWILSYNNKIIRHMIRLLLNADRRSHGIRLQFLDLVLGEQQIRMFSQHKTVREDDLLPITNQCHRTSSNDLNNKVLTNDDIINKTVIFLAYVESLTTRNWFHYKIKMFLFSQAFIYFVLFCFFHFLTFENPKRPKYCGGT